MKKKLKILIFLLAALFLWAGTSSAEVIIDEYIGANDHGYGDVIEDPGSNYFDISSMEVTFSGGYMNVKINTNFEEIAPGNRNETDTYGATYGDLFISTDGWDPYEKTTNDGYKYDNYSNGEDWEFVFDTSTGILYQLPEYDNTTINNYIYFPTDIWDPRYWIVRDGQEVKYKSGGTEISDGSSVDLSNAKLGGGYLLYQIDLSSLGSYGNEIGLKWSEDCGNDSIEGKVSVPEPTPMILLGSGLIWLAGFGRRKFLKN